MFIECISIFLTFLLPLLLIKTIVVIFELFSGSFKLSFIRIISSAEVSANNDADINNKNIAGIKNAVLNSFQMFQQGKLKFSEPLSVLQFDRKKLTGQLADIFTET